MVTVKLWKEISDFNPMENGELNVEDTVRLISLVKDKPIDEIMGMEIEDLLPEFLECVKLVNEKIFAKVNQLPKNASGDGQ